MKKLLMMGALLVLGTVAMANELGKTSVPVKVRAELMSDDLVISGIDGREILLDFGKFSSKQQGDRGAQAIYKVEYTGESTNITDGSLTVELQDKTVKMSNTLDATQEMNATLSMADDRQTTFTNTSETITGTPELDTSIKGKGEIYRGMINGVLPQSEFNGKNNGLYEGATQLSVTFTGTAGV